MSGPNFQDRFGNSDVIPHFAKNGTALTQEERSAMAKRKGLCVQCGVKTHVISVFKKAPITNDDVYKGTCIKCNPTSVPGKTLQEYEHLHPRQNAPVVTRKQTTSSSNRPPTNSRGLPSSSRGGTDRHHPNPLLSASLSGGGGAGHSDNNNNVAARHGGHQQASSKAIKHAHTHTSSGSGGGSSSNHLSSNHSKPSMSSKKSLHGAMPHRQVKSISNNSSNSNNNQQQQQQQSLSEKAESRPKLDTQQSLLTSQLGQSFSSADLDLHRSFADGGLRASTQVVEDYTGNVNAPSDVKVDQLLQALKDDRSDADLLKQTLHRIRNFGFDIDPRGVMKEIRDLMDQYINDARVMAIACSALWRLAAGKKALKIEAAENGTIESILDALRKDHNLEDTDFIQWSVGCLASLADAPEVKTFLAKMGGIEVIVDILNRNAHSAGVFEWGARALHNLAIPRDGGDANNNGNIAKNLSSIEEANGIAALVAAMKLHPNEATAQRWAMRLLWKMQDQQNEDAVTRVLKKMKDDGFVKVAVKILRARSTEAEADLFRLSAELMCNILVSDRSDAAFRDASECTTTIARSLKEDVSRDGLKHVVKLESCCRVISTLMAGTDYSRMLVGEATGVQALLKAIEKSPDNTTFIQHGIWSFWSMSAYADRDDSFLVRTSRSICVTVEAQLASVDDLLLPVCGFFGNMCLIDGMDAANIPIVAIVRALLTVEDDFVLKEAERAVANFCTSFPDQVDLVVDAFDMDHLTETLQSDADLSPTLCGVVASVASKSDRARGRMAGIIAPLVVKLDDQDNPFMTKPYLALLGTLVISGNQKSTRLPDDIVQVILNIIQTSSSRDVQWTCCALLRNLIVSAASPPNMNGLIDSMVSLVESQATVEELKLQACGVLWALTGKYSKQDAKALSDMSRSMISVLIQYKGDQGSFHYDLLAMAAGALASITSCMIHSPVIISSEDVDEIISVPYTALDFEADRTELYVRILDSIYNLSYVSDAVLIQCGVIVVVIDTMAEFEQCLAVQQFGCAILAVLASTENLQVNLSIVQTDGIDMIVNALATFSDDIVVQSQACKSLSHLSIDEESRMLIASLGGLMLLGNTMRANMDTLDLLEGALSAVLSLSADADVELLTESSIVAVVVSVMRHHRANSQIQEFGMGVLQNISMRCFESKQAIADAGGIIAVTDCIREFMGSPTVLERAFTTLWSLAVLDQNQALIAECDGINLVVNGMMTAITYEGVQKQGCGCLCTLSSDSRNKGLIQNVGGVDSIVYAMWGHYAAEEIQVEACRALSSLAVDAQTNEVMIASDGEVNAIISAMRRFPMSERLQEHGCVALRNFLLSADNVDIIKSNEHEVKTLVQQAASRFPEACQERANQVLASLG